MPLFPKGKRARYQDILEIGLSQVEFIRAPRTIDLLKEGESSRKKLLMIF